MPRSKKSQSKHDKTVKKLAEHYQNKGYKVKADLPDWEQPDTINGLRPDIIAKKGSHETVIEVETPDTEGSKRELKQQAAFKKWSKGSPTKHFAKFITEE